jgi:hypothetical protein
MSSATADGDCNFQVRRDISLTMAFSTPTMNLSIMSQRRNVTLTATHCTYVFEPINHTGRVRLPPQGFIIFSDYRSQTVATRYYTVLQSLFHHGNQKKESAGFIPIILCTEIQRRHSVGWKFWDDDRQAAPSFAHCCQQRYN